MSSIVALWVLIPITLPWVAWLVWTAVSSSRQQSMVWLLAVAVRKQLPLGPAVEAMAFSYTGGYRDKALALAEMLNAGVSLPDALDRLPGLVPDPTRIAVRVGYEVGSVEKALDTADVSSAIYREVWQSLLLRVAYLWLVIVYFLCISVFTMIYIVPKFMKIFSDFGMDLPPVTKALVDVSSGISGGSVWPFVIWWSFLAFLTVSSMLVIPGPWRTFARDWLFARLDAGTVLRALAIRVEANRPIVETIGLLSAMFPKPGIRFQLVQASLRIQNGVLWHDAMRQARLITRGEAALLEAAQRVGDLGWALREVANGGDRRFGYRLRFLLNVMSPLVIVAIGALVAFYVIACFLPLINLLGALGR